jgi:PAS domain S-box-containing protein
MSDLAIMITRKAAKMLVLTWLAAAGSPALSQEEASRPMLTGIDQVRALSAMEVASSPQVRIEAVVTLSLTRRSYVWIEDEQNGIRLYIRDRAFSLQPGDRVMVSGTAVPGEIGPMIAPDQIRVLSNGNLPEPPMRTAAQLNTFSDVNRRIQVDGRVVQVIEKPSRYQIELVAGPNRFWAELSRQTNDNWTALMDATVRVRGVCVRQVFDWGETVQPALLVQSAADISILQPGQPKSRKNLEELSVVPIASLTRESITKNSETVRIRGTILDQRLGEHIVIRDGSGTLRADSSLMFIIPAMEQVDVWGTPVWETEGVSLQNATYRLVNTSSVTDGRPESPTQKPASLPTLTSASDLMALSAEQAGWRYPVRLRGVVMIYYPDRRQFFVQDDSAGFYVRGPWNRNDLKTGDLVEVTGFSDAGGYAPMVIPQKVTTVGTAALPPARRATLFQMATGQFDSQWIEAYGVVRSCTEDNNLLRIKLTDSDGTLFVYLPGEPVPPNLIDSVVRVRGVCTTHPNANRQISSLVVWSPALDFFKIEDPGPSAPADIRIQSIGSLGQYRPRNVLQRRVKVEGVVTMRQSDKSFFIQDHVAGVEAQTDTSDHEIKAGDRVIVTGYPMLGNYGVVLRDALFHVAGHESMPSAKPLSPEHGLNPQMHNMLVQVEARLQFRTRINDRDVLTLQVPGWIFEADSAGAASTAALPVGSLLRITGVYRTLVDEARAPTAFQLLVPSGGDIEILEKPSWWGIKHILAVVGMLVLLVAATTLWVVMLRRKVQGQTASLQSSEMKFRSLVEQSLVGVYIIQDERFAYVNPRQAEIFGQTPEQMLQMLVLDNVVEEDRPLVGEQIQRRISGEMTTAHYNFRGLRKDGSIVHVEVLGSRTEYNGKPAVLGTTLDVTARKRAEEELFNSRQMLRTVLDTVPQRVFWKDRNSLFAGCNKAFASDRGYGDPSELVGKSDFDAHPTEAAAGHQAEDQQIMSTGTARLNHEVLHRNKDGTQSWMKLSKVPLFDKQGNVNGVLGTYEDITERKQAEAALAEASILLETLLTNSPDYIYFKDRQSHFVRASQSLASIFNMSGPGELIGKSDFDFFKTEHAKAAFEDEQEIIRTGKPIIGKPEKEDHADGRTTWALTTKLPWRDKAGDIIGTFGISKDVTAIKEAESKLAHEKGLFQALVENLPDAIYFKDRESRFVRMSRSKIDRARQILINVFHTQHPGDDLPGHLATSDACAEYLVGKSDFDVYPELRARASFDEEQTILRTGQPLIGHIEKFTQPEDGSTVWYHTTKMPWRDEQGNIIGTFGVTRDITQLKEAEAVLDYERELFRTLLDHFPDSIYFKDLQSRFVRVSRSKVQGAMDVVRANFETTHPSEPLPEYLSSAERFEEYLVGKTDFDTFTEERARNAFEDEQNIIRTGMPLLGKVERTTRLDGKVTWCISTKIPWRSKEGQVIGTFGVSKDVTALKEAESQLDKAHQRLVETSRLAGMAEVATDVLHNVGNVLNSVNISCSLTIDRIKTSKMANLSKVAVLLEEHRGRLGEFFANDPRGQQIPDYVSALAEHLRGDQTVLLKDLEQLLKHIDHIKQIVAMQQSYAKVAGVKEMITATQLVEDALHINAAALVRHDVHVEREFHETPPISTEKHKVLQILVNLIRNAKYAMDDAKPPRKVLIIRTSTQDDNIKIEVVDNGIGIPTENLTRIFGHGFTTRRNGHGFGLHSSALAVKELGGVLDVHSDGPGTGATFTLLLPLKSMQKTEVQRYEPATT